MPLKFKFLFFFTLTSGLFAQGFALKPSEAIPALTLTLTSAREQAPHSTQEFLGKKTMLHVFASW